MNVVCVHVGGQLYLLISRANLLFVKVFNHDFELRELNSLVFDSDIRSFTVCQCDDSVALIIIVADSGVSFVWAPAFASSQRFAGAIATNSDWCACYVKSALLVSSNAKFYVSSLFRSNSDSIDIRGDALKVSIELGSVNQISPMDEDMVVDLVSVAPTSSSIVMVLKNVKTGFYSVRWADLDKTLKVKWVLAFSSETISVISLSDNEESRPTAVVGIVAAQTIHMANSSGILSKIQLSMVGFIVSALRVNAPTTPSDSCNMLVSTSDGGYLYLTISKASWQLTGCLDFSASSSSFVPCCETLSVLSLNYDESKDTPHSFKVFGYHSQFGYQVLSISTTRAEVGAQSVHWNDSNCQLLGLTRMIRTKDPTLSSHITVCQSSALDQSSLLRIEISGCTFHPTASVSLENTPLAGLCTLSLPVSETATRKDALVMFSNRLSSQSSLFVLQNSSPCDLIAANGSYVVDELTLGLFEAAGRLFQITPTGITVLKYVKDGRLSLDGPKTIFSDLIQAALKKDAPTCRYSIDCGGDCSTRPSTRQEVLSSVNLSSSPRIEHCAIVSDIIVLSVKNLVFCVSIGHPNTVTDVLLTSSDVACLAGGVSDSGRVSLLCIALWSHSAVCIKSLGTSMSTLYAVKLLETNDGTASAVRHLCLLSSDNDFLLVCGTADGLVSVVQLNVHISTYDVLHRINLREGIQSCMMLTKHAVAFCCETRDCMLSNASGGWFVVGMTSDGSTAKSQSYVRIDNDTVGRLSQGIEESSCFELGRVIENKTRVTRRSPLSGLVIDIVTISDYVLVLHRSACNVHRISALDSSSLHCFWSHCIEPSCEGPSKQYRLVSGPEPPITSAAALSGVTVFSLISTDGVTPLSDLTPGTSVSADSSVVCTTFMLQKSSNSSGGGWSVQPIGGVSVPYSRLPEWKQDQIDLVAAHTTPLCASVNASAVAVVVPYNRLLVLGWTDNRRERVAVLDKAAQGKSGTKVSVPRLMVKLESVAEYSDDAQTSMTSMCCSNDRFIYLGLANVGVDILMLSRSNALEFEGNGYTLQTVYKLRDITVSPTSQLCAFCVEPSAYLTTDCVFQPVNRFKIVCYGGASDPILVFVNINGILRTISEPYELNNEVVQVKPDTARLQVRGKSRIKFVEAAAAARCEGFRYWDTEGSELVVEELHDSL